MKNKLKEYIRKKRVGIDLLDNHLTALELGKGVYVSESIESIHINIPQRWNTKKVREKLLSADYIYNESALKYLIKYCIKKLGKQLFFPMVALVFPFEGKEEWEKVGPKAAQLAGTNYVTWLDNFTCAAKGSKIMNSVVNENSLKGRQIFIYSSKNKTYIGIFFLGNGYGALWIDKDYNEITKNDIENKIDEMIKDMPKELPPQYYRMKLTQDVLENINKAWKQKIDEKIYLAVPDTLKGRLGDSIKGREAIYSDCYDVCIQNGLADMIKIRKEKVVKIKQSKGRK